MDDFDSDGLLDVVVTSTDPTEPMAYYHNRGDGTFEDRTRQAGVTDQLGGLVCYQADYNNDGWLDIFIPRGAWCDWPIRPTLLRNNGAGGFTDVTAEAGLAGPGEFQRRRLGRLRQRRLGRPLRRLRAPAQPPLSQSTATAHSRRSPQGRSGGRRRIASPRAAPGSTTTTMATPTCSSITCEERGRLYHNDRDGRFTEVTTSMGIDGPHQGFSCWAWDYDNDGWLDIFATSIDRDSADVVKGMIGPAAHLLADRLFRNLQGQGFEDRTEAGRPRPGFCAPWGATSPISTTTAGSISTWAPASRAWPPWSPTACSRTSAAVDSPTSPPLPAPATFKGPRRGLRRLGPRRRRRPLHRDRRRRQRRQVSQRPLPEPRPRKPLADREARRQKDQSRGHRCPDQGGDRRRTPADDPPASSPQEAASVQIPSSKRSAWPRRPGGDSWKSTGRPAKRPRSSATSRPTRPSRSPSTPKTIAVSTGISPLTVRIRCSLFVFGIPSRAVCSQITDSIRPADRSHET